MVVADISDEESRNIGKIVIKDLHQFSKILSDFWQGDNAELHRAAFWYMVWMSSFTIDRRLSIEMALFKSYMSLLDERSRAHFRNKSMLLSRSMDSLRESFKTLICKGV